MNHIIADQFWFNDHSIIWRKDRLTEFFPREDHALEERLNANFRLGIYVSIVLYFYRNDFRYFAIAGLVGLVTIYLYNEQKNNKIPERSVPLKQTAVDYFIDPAEKIETLRNTACTKPTMDNPFMNVTMKDYMNIKNGQIVDRPPACDTAEVEVKKEMDEYFNNNLYRDVEDIFGKMNSQRQFYTMPSTTIPNAQDEFARWLYESPKTCKEDQDFCLRYEDVRAKRPIMVDSTKNPTKS